MPSRCEPFCPCRLLGNASSLCAEKTNAAMTLPPLVPCTHSCRCMSHSAAPSDKRSRAGPRLRGPARAVASSSPPPALLPQRLAATMPHDNPLACSAGNCCLAGPPFPQNSAQNGVRLLWSCSRGLAPKLVSSVAHLSLAGQTSCSFNVAASAASLPHMAATSLVKPCLAACTPDTHPSYQCSYIQFASPLLFALRGKG